MLLCLWKTASQNHRAHMNGSCGTGTDSRISLNLLSIGASMVIGLGPVTLELLELACSIAYSFKTQAREMEVIDPNAV